VSSHPHLSTRSMLTLPVKDKHSRLDIDSDHTSISIQWPRYDLLQHLSLDSAPVSLFRPARKALQISRLFDLQ
jgi:hypothetical protein